MDMQGEYRIPAPRQDVWDALNDPDVLRRSIPGCESLEKTSETTFEAKVTAKVGPVKAKFAGAVTLADIAPPQSYTISGEGKGGAAGFAKGSADVALEEDGEATVLRYTVKATVGGKLTQLGGRLIDATAKKMANEFFGNFVAIVSGQDEAAPDAPTSDETKQGQPAPKAVGAAPSPATPAAAAAAAAAKQESAAAAATPGLATAKAAATAGVTDKPRPRAAGGLSPTTWISGVILLVLAILAAVQFF